MQFSLRQLLIAVTCFCIVIAMFAHGNALLGTRAGILFGSLAAGTLFVLWRVFCKRRTFQMTRQVTAVLFASAVFVILAFPARFNRDLAADIERHRTERAIRTQVHNVLSSDPRFSQLAVQYIFQTGKFMGPPVTIAIAGEIQTESALLELRDRILENCPLVHSSWLYWDVTVNEAGIRYDDYDPVNVGEPASDARARHGKGLDLNSVGAPPGTNPGQTLLQQTRAFAAVAHAVSVEIKQLNIGGPAHDARITVTDKVEIGQIVASLNFAPLGPQNGESVGPCLAFRLENGREIAVHIRDGQWWCFTGGVRRRLDPRLWDYLGRLRREQGQ